jgi:hypothetical protein
MFMGFKQVMLGLGVGILAALFIGFFIEAVHSAPKYEDFCKNNYYDYPKMMNPNNTCDFVYDTTLRNACMNDNGMMREEYDAKGCITKETCDYCQRDFQNAEEKYNRNLFYITAPIGLLLIILGLYLPISVDAITGGILLGGILTLLQVTTRVFGNLGKWPRVILLGLELAIIIWIGIKKLTGNRDEDDPKVKPKRKKK